MRVRWPVVVDHPFISSPVTITTWPGDPAHSPAVLDGTGSGTAYPATSPRGRQYTSMAYDAATGTVVLFGGINNKSQRLFRDTWTWDGTT